MDLEERIIEFVRTNQILVDKCRRKQEKDKKWKEMSMKLSISESKAKKKWRNIRDRYYRLKKQTPKKRPYKYEALLSFLDECSTDKSKFMVPFMYDDDVDSLCEISDDSQTGRNEEIQSNEALPVDECDTTATSSIAQTIGNQASIKSLIGEGGSYVKMTPFCSGLPSDTISGSPLFEKVQSGHSEGMTASVCESDNPIAADPSTILSSFKESCNNTKENSFCNNLAIQLQDAALPTNIFAKFQFEVYQAFYAAVREKTERYE